MTLTQIKYVMEIAKAGSVNNAANNLFVSQSVLSNSLKLLENELDEKIFFRTPHGMTPTPFGKLFISNIEPIQQHIDQLNIIFNKSNNPNKESISIATTGFSYINTIISQLLQRHSSVELKIKILESSLDEIMMMVSNGVVNLAFIRRWNCYYNITTKRLRSLKIEYYPINSFPMGITIGPGNPLFYSDCTSITTDMLKNYPCIIYDYLDSGPYHDIYERLKLPPSSRIIVNSRAAMQELTATTSGYYFNALLPEILSNDKSHIALLPQRTLPLIGCKIQTEYGWLIRKNYLRSPIEDECIEMVSHWLQSNKNAEEEDIPKSQDD